TDRDGDTASANLQIDLSSLLVTAPVVTQAAETTLLANEGGVEATAALGIAVGRDAAGATVAIGDTSQLSLVGKAVTAGIMVGGSEVDVALTSGGEALVYRSDGSGGLLAVKASDPAAVVFRLSASATDGT